MCLQALAGFGEAAAPHIPAIAALFHHEDERVRKVAVKVIHPHRVPNAAWPKTLILTHALSHVKLGPYPRRRSNASRT